MTQNEDIRVVGSNKVMLFDDHCVEQKAGFSLRQGVMCRDTSPVLVPDKPWEADGITGDSSCTVMEHEGMLKMWYVVPSPFKKNERGHDAAEKDLNGLDEKTRNDLLNPAANVLCYAFSRDGVQWEKPALDIIEYKGASTNMLLAGRMGATVFLDPSDEPERRFKMIHGFGPRLQHVVPWSQQKRYIFHGIYGSYSPDGIHWRTHPDPIIPWYTDTTNVAYYDERIGKYVAFVRYNENLTFIDNATRPIRRGAEHYRAVGRTESEDFFSFPPPVKIAEPTPLQRRPRDTGMDFYNTSAIIYPDSPDAYLMLSSNFYHEQDVLQVHLATSRDGIHYRRRLQPVLTPGTEGRFDCRSIYMATGLVQRKDEMWLYYNGRDWLHGEDRTQSDTGGGIGRVRMRLDGFIAQHAGFGGGQLLTVPLQYDGDRLVVNMDAAAGGRLKVELCDINGTPLQGWGADDADWLFYSDTRKVASWKGKTALPQSNGNKLRLRFTGDNVDIYSFRFVESSKAHTDICMNLFDH